MPPNPHPDSIPSPMWDILYSAEQRVKYVVAPVASEDNPGAAEAFDGYDDPDFHRSSKAEPFKGLCLSLKEDYAGTGQQQKNMFINSNIEY